MIDFTQKQTTQLTCMTDDQVSGDHELTYAVRIMENIYIDIGRFERHHVERLNLVLAGLYGQQFAF